jgi:hypothetical protein
VRKTLCLMATLFITNASATPEAVRLECGAVKGFKSEVEMKPTSNPRINTVDVTFIGKKPSNKQIDKALRACAATAIKRDASRDILVSAWSRKRASSPVKSDTPLHPHGSMKYLSYEASSKTVAVRKIKF